MNKSRQDIIDKVQKLLALANSSNEHEAQIAAQRAQALLVKYNLTMNDVDIEDGEEKYIAEKFGFGQSRTPMEWKYIQSLLQEFYFIKIVHSRKPIFDGPWLARTANGRIKTQGMFMFIGKNHNVQIAKYVKDFLVRSFRELFEKYQKETGAKASSRDSYYAGLYSGLVEQLKKTQKDVEQECGLVVVEDADLQKHIDEMFEKLRTKAISHNVHDQNAIEAGKEEGKNLRIARGLEGTASTHNKIGETLKLGGKV